MFIETHTVQQKDRHGTWFIMGGFQGKNEAINYAHRAQKDYGYPTRVCESVAPYKVIAEFC